MRTPAGGTWTAEALSAAYPGWEITRAGLKVTATREADGAEVPGFPVSPAVLACVLADCEWRALMARFSQLRHLR